jgi:glutamyl-tRNA synthetase
MQRQFTDLAALGLQWDPPVLQQSERLPLYHAAIHKLIDRGFVFECFCSRKEILSAPSAPHAPLGAYPGICRDLTPTERQRKREAGRAPALRLRSQVSMFTVQDELHGEYTGSVDDFVLQRSDGVPAYNLAVVIDDAESGVDQVVRGDDLLSSSPRQAYLATLLDYEVPSYAHVPLVVNQAEQRLSKRDGAATLADLERRGVSAGQVLAILASSLGLADCLKSTDSPLLTDDPESVTITLQHALSRFHPAKLPKHTWVWSPGARCDGFS